MAMATQLHRVPTSARLRMLGNVTAAAPKLRMTEAAALTDLAADHIERGENEKARVTLRLVMSRQAAMHLVDTAARAREPFHVEP